MSTNRSEILPRWFVSLGEVTNLPEEREKKKLVARERRKGTEEVSRESLGNSSPWRESEDQCTRKDSGE